MSHGFVGVGFFRVTLNAQHVLARGISILIPWGHQKTQRVGWSLWKLGESDVRSIIFVFNMWTASHEDSCNHQTKLEDLPLICNKVYRYTLWETDRGQCRWSVAWESSGMGIKKIGRTQQRNVKTYNCTRQFVYEKVYHYSDWPFRSLATKTLDSGNHQAWNAQYLPFQKRKKQQGMQLFYGQPWTQLMFKTRCFFPRVQHADLDLPSWGRHLMCPQDLEVFMSFKLLSRLIPDNSASKLGTAET